MTNPPPPGPEDHRNPTPDPLYQPPIEAYTPPPDRTYQLPPGHGSPYAAPSPTNPGEGSPYAAPGTAYPAQDAAYSGPSYPPPAYPAYPPYPGQPYQPPGHPYATPAYQYGYADPYGYAPPRPTDGLAIASMVVSCIAVPAALCLYGFAGLIGIVGAILGHVSRRRIRTTGAGGGGMALAGVIVGWIAAGLGLLIGIALIVLITHGDDFTSI
jgi:uncharacterized protein DUF4190